MTTPVAPGSAKRAAGLVLLAVVLAVTCGLLGRWQWIRHTDRDAVISGIEANYDARPVPLARLLPEPGAVLPDADVWRPVTAVGHYDTEHTALLRNRPVDGENGYQLLVPFVLEDDGSGAAAGAVIIVDRGWVPLGPNDRPSVVPAPPSGRVEVVVRLRADEPASPRGAPVGQVQAISTAQVLAAGGIDPATVRTYGAYGALGSEQPAAPAGVNPLVKPSLDPGSHLSYAFQWWTFALGALIGFSRLGWLELHEGDPGAPVDATRRRRSPSAEDEEDALIDSQLP